jgi:hypothetical protein
MEAAREVFVPGNPQGVFAFGIAPRITRGVPSRWLTLNAYVQRKQRKPQARIEPLSFRARGATYTLLPNVVGTGKTAKPTHGEEQAFDGLYPGAAIRVDGPPRGYGGVACFVGSGGQATHFVTAGHLFAPDAVGQSVFAAADPDASVVEVGTLALNLLDTSSVDAAIVTLTDEGIELLAASTGGPALKGVLGEPSVWDTQACMYSPLTLDFSRAVFTNKGPLDAFLDAEPRGAYQVRDAVGTDGSISEQGDSGSILCAGLNNELALGICVGEFKAQSIFVPVARALRLAAPTLGRLRLV